MAREPEEAYVKEIEALRREKDYFFREDPESPIPQSLRARFVGLAYFPVEPKYRVHAMLVREPNPQRVVMATSKGGPRHMVRVGLFEVQLDCTQLRHPAHMPVTLPVHRRADHG